MHVKALNTAESLLKPPISERLRSGYVILKPGEAVGEHSTNAHEEMLVILQGTACIACEGEAQSVTVAAQSVAYIPKHRRHNVMNQSSDDLKYIYLVTPVE